MQALVEPKDWLNTLRAYIWTDQKIIVVATSRRRARTLARRATTKVAPETTVSPSWVVQTFKDIELGRILSIPVDPRRLSMEYVEFLDTQNFKPEAKLRYNFYEL